MGKSTNNLISSQGEIMSQRLYYIWHNMKSRCRNENHVAYKNYGGRGINICDEWSESYSNFKEWAMISGYSEQLTLERKDVNGNYEQNNCKWASRKEQGNNKRNNVLFTINNETKTLTEWGDIIGINGHSFARRIKNFKTNSDLNQLLKSPKEKKDYRSATIEINNISMTLEEISQQYKIKLRTIITRYIRGCRDETNIKKGSREKRKH